ncbi:hypothetical protein [Methylobacillus sp.]|uniref:pilus assembly PilX family protein n=1 Tax=Methylobacillus sp. TaxID=56818 RepID=UPI0012C20EA0|nr:hypothetical protein [Methylobacillus sp.]MPS47613.1 hypothetical protein [Methylobacillus sp.]
MRSKRKYLNQRGIIMLITLMALVILTLASVALIRSSESNLLIAGNLAFKRDVVNQGERAIQQIKRSVISGALSSDVLRLSDSKANNYFSTILPSNIDGVPSILLDRARFDAELGANNIVDNDAQITIRYVIDRLCLQTGEIDVASCAISASTTDVGGDARALLKKPGGVDVPLYRISIRVTGPRNTEAFMQSTFTI